jgi:hypothetical protein
LIGVFACLAALQGGQAGAGGGALGSASVVMPALTPSVQCDGGVGTPRYNAVDAEEGGHGNGLSRREA